MSNIDIFGTRTIAVSVGTALNIITINSAEIVITKPLSMANCNICNVATPLNATDAVNKAYVDAKLTKKCYSGYIPLLEANRSMLGFNANASSIITSNYAPYKAFNNFEEAWVASDTTGWLQIECPEAVTIWKVALKARAHSERNIMAWNIAGSNDESTFTTLLTSTNALLGAATSPSFFNIATTTAYKFYRFNITSYIGSPDVGMAVMQLYVLTD